MRRRRRRRHTRVDEVVRVVVVTDGARLGLVELGVLDFFELDHGFLFFFWLDWLGLA